MATIDIRRKHNLGYQKAHEITDKLSVRLADQFNAECHWDGPELRFNRSGASGRVRISDDSVQVEVKLGMLLSPLKGKMEKIIDEQLDTLLKA